jgi:meso-butanediol dehydrogenase/(S,S)-butanediol dehydrogenase/diacetyl reductase
MDLKGKIAIITGGARNIGHGIATVLAQRGADIAIADIDEQAAADTAKELSALGVRTLAVKMDVTSWDSVRKAVDQVLKRFGRMDILVNNAGVIGRPGWSEHFPIRDEDWDFCFQVNVRGMMVVSEVVSGHMKKRREGKIVNIASISGRSGRPVIPHYSASKAAAINYSQALALQLAPYNINVNCVCPGILRGPMFETLSLRYWKVNHPGEPLPSVDRAVDDAIQSRVPLKRVQTPEDVGKAVAFFASDDALNITGQSLNVDGGNFLN